MREHKDKSRWYIVINQTYHKQPNFTSIIIFGWKTTQLGESV